MPSDATISCPSMPAVRLHGPRDLRLDRVPQPGPPGPGQVRLAVEAVGICGSDLHTYLDGRIGNTALQGPLVLGHEFAGTVEAVGDAVSLQRGERVAVDPCWSCGSCELCVNGHPNLCLHHTFCGLWPTHGALQASLLVPASACFSLPPELDAEQGAMLEPLGIAIHAVDLAHLRVGSSVAILGAGPIGLLITQVARLAGARPMFITDRLPARLQLAAACGGEAIHLDADDPVAEVMRRTGGRGVDVAIEAAWADHSVQQAVDMTRPGGRVVLVGIPGDDRLTLQHSAARRRGLTIAFCRRMKHTYPRAIDLVRRGDVDVKAMITHRYALADTADAFRCVAAYDDGVVKAIVAPR